MACLKPAGLCEHKAIRSSVSRFQMLSAGRCPQSAFGCLRRCRVSRKGSGTPDLTTPKPKKRGTERFRMHRAKLLSLRPVRQHRLAVSLVAPYSAARPGVAVAVSQRGHTEGRHQSAVSALRALAITIRGYPVGCRRGCSWRCSASSGSRCMPNAAKSRARPSPVGQCDTSAEGRRDAVRWDAA